MERCLNCLFYNSLIGECAIDCMVISEPDICVCDCWELSSRYDVNEFDDDFNSAWCRREIETNPDIEF